MKQVLTPEDINTLEDMLERTTPAPWTVIDNADVNAAWVSPDNERNPVALFDYRTAEQNKYDAYFVVYARNYMRVLIDEIKILRKRILEVIQSNNIEVQKRLDLQSELNELKKMMQDIDEHR